MTPLKNLIRLMVRLVKHNIFKRLIIMSYVINFLSPLEMELLLSQLTIGKD